MRRGNVPVDEMTRVFNCGIGMVVIVAADEAERARAVLASMGETVHGIGRVVARKDGEAGCRVIGADQAWHGA